MEWVLPLEEAVAPSHVLESPPSGCFSSQVPLGLVIGSWLTDLPVAGEAGVLPYVYVHRVDDRLDRSSLTVVRL